MYLDMYDDDDADENQIANEYTESRLRYLIDFIVIVYALVLMSVEVGFVLLTQREEMELEKMTQFIMNKTPMTI